MQGGFRIFVSAVQDKFAEDHRLKAWPLPLIALVKSFAKAANRLVTTM